MDGMDGMNDTYNHTTELWKVYLPLANEHFAMRRISKADGIITVFRDLFSKETKK